jgi:glycosyltransferase involved in cell wall biosynthesis
MPELPNNTKVLIAIPVLLIGGTEMHTVSLVKALASGGYHNSICCYYDYDSSMVSKLEEQGSEVFLLGLRPSDGLFVLLVKLIALFKKIKPDIIHVQYIAPGLIPIIAAKVAGIKMVFATLHQPGRPYGWKPKILIRIAAYLCDAFFCNSKSVEKSWFEDCQVFDPEKMDPMRKHFTIYNGVDIGSIERIVKQTDKESLKESLNIESKRVVGIVGRLRKEKGHQILLESMRVVIQELPDTVLIVVGDGPDRPHLEEMARKLSIDGLVKWLGQKDPDEVLRLYSIMDVVVVPSLFEGFGLTAAEAMASGKPVVASEVDGIREVIEKDATGFLVPPGNIQALGNAVKKILSDCKRREAFGIRGKERVLRNFSIQQFRTQILSAYQHFSRIQ